MNFGNEYVQINSNLFLTEYNFITLDSKLGNKVKKRDPLNHLFIYDRSGSMYGLLDDLVEDLITRVKNIPIGDTVTFGWFSGEGQKNFILKGFKISESKDYSILEKSLRANKTTIGCTCFSEILHDADQVIEDLSVISSNFTLCFFTDGFPVVSCYSKEIKEIHAAISKLNGRVSASLLVGYGDYYNKQLMSEMAAKIGGSLTHSANLSSFSVSLDSFLGTAQDSKKITVKIDAPLTKDSLIFNINGKNINLYEANDNNEIQLSCNEDEKTSVFVLTDIKPKGVEIKNSLDLERALYACAYILTQKTKTDVAIDLLGFLGDKKLVDLVTNSYTNAEYGVTEENIKEAIFDLHKRYLDGKVKNYVPPVDAFCLLDLIDLLAEDSEAYFYPRNDAFVYKRIGKPAIPDEKYPKFEGDEHSKSSFADVVWNETKLNLSLRAYITGTIDLPAEAKKYGLLHKFPTFQYRNYTFVKDGILNVTKVPVTLSESSYKVLLSKGVILPTVKWKKDRILILNLDAVPIVNRKIAEGKTSATELCKWVLEEQKCKATIKALKWYKNRDFPEKEITTATAKTFAEKQQAFLESIGINTKTGAYEPPVSYDESTDFYMAKEFSVKVKGLSSLPKIEVVADKIKGNKKLTTSDTLVAVGVNLYGSQNFKSDNEKLNWFQQTLETYTTNLKKVRRQIQETKFAVLLGKKWFDCFKSREDNTITLEGYEFSFCLEEKKVPI